MANLAELVVSLALDTREYSSGITESATQATNFAGTLGTAVVGAAGLAGAALVGVGAVALDFASEASQGVKDFSAELGITREEAERLGDVGLDVYANNWGDSLTDVNDSISTVVSNMKNIAPDDIQGATEAALALRDTFDIDVAESTAAANTLMKNFGLSSKEAFDFITKGNQAGLNASGDFLDTIGEYSTQFSNGGASAEQFFSLMQTGLQNGVLGTDKAADSFKEFRVRIQDGSALTSDSLKMLGLDADKITKGLADGSITAADAYGMVTTALKNTKDTTVQFQAGVGLLGTQFEDLGASGVAAIDLTATSLEDLAGATDSLNVKYGSFGSMFEGVQRQALVALEPLGGKLLELGNVVVPVIITALAYLGSQIPAAFAWLETNALPLFTSIYNAVMLIATGDFSGGIFGLAEDSPWINALFIGRDLLGVLIGYIADNAQPILAGLGAMLLAVVVPAVYAWAAATATAAATTIAALAPVLLPILAIGAAVAVLYYAWENNFGGIRDIVANVISVAMPYIDTAKSSLMDFANRVLPLLFGAWETISGAVTIVITALAGAILSNMAGIQNTISAAMAFVGAVFRTGWDLVTGIFTAVLLLLNGDVTGFVTTLVTTFTGFFSNLGGVATAGLNLIYSLFDTTWSLLVSFLGGVWSQIGTTVSTGLSNLYNNALTSLANLRDLVFAATFAAVIVLFETFLGNDTSKGVQGVFRRLWAGFEGGVQVALDWMKGMIFGPGMDKIVALVGDRLTELMNKVGSIPAQFGTLVNTFKTEAGRLGSAVIDGVAGMISAGAGRLADAVSSALNSAIEAGKRALGIASPSKVTYEDWGIPIMQGPIAAFNDMLPSLKRAAERVAQTIVGAGRAMIGSPDVRGSAQAALANATSGGPRNQVNITGIYREREGMTLTDEVRLQAMILGATPV